MGQQVDDFPAGGVGNGLEDVAAKGDAHGGKDSLT